MPTITVIRPFRHADGVYPVLYETGAREVSDRCAEVAVAEGWARPFAPAGAPASPAGSGSGEDAPSSSPHPARPSMPTTLRRSKGGKARAGG